MREALNVGAKIVRLVACLSLVAVPVFVSSCDGTGIRYESTTTAYTLETVGEIAAKVDLPSFEGRPAAEAEALRHDQLVALRSNGDEASRLADLLTSAFPAESRSVPYYAEEASVDGRPAWIVLEVWGPSDGTLENTRLWAFDRDTGEVLLALSNQRGSDR